MIETTFSMVRRKFGDSLRAKTDLVLKTETLAKFVCHTICCVIAGAYERDPKFLALPAAAEANCTAPNLLHSNRVTPGG